MESTISFKQITLFPEEKKEQVDALFTRAVQEFHDRIIVLDSGHVAEEGTHAELLANEGLYARMWKDYNQAVRWKITTEKEAE